MEEQVKFGTHQFELEQSKIIEEAKAKEAARNEKIKLVCEAFLKLCENGGWIDSGIYAAKDLARELLAGMER